MYKTQDLRVHFSQETHSPRISDSLLNTSRELTRTSTGSSKMSVLSTKSRSVNLSLFLSVGVERTDQRKYSCAGVAFRSLYDFQSLQVSGSAEYPDSQMWW